MERTQFRREICQRILSIAQENAVVVVVVVVDVKNERG